MIEDEGPRTYSIWLFVVVFAVLGIVGLVALLVLGNPRTPTVQVQLPSSTTVAAAPSTTATSEDEPPTPPTMPGGAPAPPGVRESLREGGTTSYAFSVPEELARVPFRAEVPAATVVPTADGTGVVVRVTCSAGAGEALAQISITEDATALTVLPVVIVAADAGPCDPAAVVAEVTLTLGEPVGPRQILVVPAGTSVPRPQVG